MICFTHKEFRHISTRCPNMEDKDENKLNKLKGKKEFKNYKDFKRKGNKSCHIPKDFDSDEDEDEVVYIVVKDESDDE